MSRFAPTASSTREFYRPKDTAPAYTDADLGIEIYHEGTTSAKGFAGKRAAPDFYMRFRSAERRDEYIADYIKGQQDRAARKLAERHAKAGWQHGCKVGDIFRCLWGYDQTNIDYYEIVKVCGKAVEVLEIASQSQETGWLQGDSVPAPGKYVQEADYKSPESLAHHERTGCYLMRTPAPRRMIPQRGYRNNSEPSLSIHSYASAYPHKPTEIAPGVKVFKPDHWTAYA